MAVSVMCILIYPSLAFLFPSIPVMFATPAHSPSLLLFLQYGYTPLHLAADKGHLESVRLLLDCGADKEAKTNVRGEGRGDWCHIAMSPCTLPIPYSPSRRLWSWHVRGGTLLSSHYSSSASLRILRPLIPGK